jgi:hypothetical protein
VDSSVLLVLEVAVLELVELVELVVVCADDDDNDHPAALSRSEYCMLQRTMSFLAAVPGAQLVRRGQHAFSMPSPRFVQGTEFCSSQTEGWSM